MKRTDPNAWLGLLFLLLLVMAPLAVGILATKIFRLFYPLKKEEEGLNSIMDIGKPTGDRFYIMALVGWIICGPVYFWFYKFWF